MSILKREVYYDVIGGVVRFYDWAIATTTLGAMAEPFCVDSRHAMQTQTRNFDPTDPMAFIHEMHRMNKGKEKLVLSGGVHQLNGGPLMPRVGP